MVNIEFGIALGNLLAIIDDMNVAFSLDAYDSTCCASLDNVGKIILGA
jgi:hypothetical protein